MTDIKRVYPAEERPITPFLTAKGIKKFWKSWKWNQLKRN